MANTDVLIIGAGATGLMAGRQLAKAGKKVTVLEARNRIGGRIHTINSDNGIAELGAEFIHGDLPVTLALLKEAGIGYHVAGGNMLYYKDGGFQHGQDIAGWDEVMDSMKQLRQDTNMNAFLDKHFAGDRHKELREQVRRYVSGYDTADPDNASVFALREEWMNEDEGAQHRLNNGYCEMINYLAEDMVAAGGTLILNAVVKTIRWSDTGAEACCMNGETYQADKMIIALPLGVLKTDGLSGGILFEPPLPAQQQAFGQIGFGAIIKVLLRFKDRFWDDARNMDLSQVLFFMSDEQIPTWWTQAPRKSHLLTGWLGGDPSRRFIHSTSDELLHISLKSISAIFGVGINNLEDMLTEWHIANWTADPFTLGSYAYDMISSNTARRLLNQPVANTLYFAGEYLYHGPSMGTVEAALTSAMQVAGKITAET